MELRSIDNAKSKKSLVRRSVFWIAAWGVVATSLFLAFTAPTSSENTIADVLGTPRSFVFHYRFSVENVPTGARKVEVWVPVPHTDEHQTIGPIRVSSGFSYETIDEPTHGNRFVLVDLTNAAGVAGRLDVAVSYRVDRLPYRSRFARKQLMMPSKAELARYLQPNRLVPLDGPIALEAQRVVGNRNDPFEQARALYDNIVRTVRYDKSGTGWGRGDALRVCDMRSGNCTDFHSLFIAEARSLGIPARFVMGFPIPEDAPENTIGGYHCWAEFYAENYGWVPIDASEAHKNPGKREALFGGLDAGRIAVTMGRDIEIPGTDGELFNFVIYPYVEVDGERHDRVKTRFSYTALSPHQRSHP